MPRARQVATQDEFTGGLNLRANQFQLGANESPDLMNVDIDPRGGVRLRRGVAPWGDELDAAAHSLGQFRSSSVSQVIAGVADTIVYGTGTTWTEMLADNTVSHPLSFAQFKDNLYIQNGTDAPVKWTGTTDTRLTQAYSEDFDLPGSGKMPKARYIAAHNGHVFVAHTLESSTSYPNRVRWSHPNQPEAWRALDYIDIDPGVDGDEIVALVPHSDHLLVFKRRSVHVIYGFGWESFAVQKVSADNGCSNAQAVASTPQGVYWWSPDSGVWRYGGRGVEWVYSSLWPSIEDGDVNPSRQDEVRLGWLENRLWVSVPWGASASRCFVLDPTIAKSGAWTQYDLGLGPMLAFGPDDQPATPLAACGAFLVELELENQPWDEFGDTEEVSTPTETVNMDWDATETAAAFNGDYEPITASSGPEITLPSVSVADAGGTITTIGVAAVASPVETETVLAMWMDYVDSGTPVQALLALVAVSGVSTTVLAGTGYDWRSHATAEDAVAFLDGAVAEFVATDVSPTELQFASTITLPGGTVVGGNQTLPNIDGDVTARVQDTAELTGPVRWSTFQVADIGSTTTTEVVQHHIDAWYTTPWFDMNQPAVIKRFHAPTFVFLGDTADPATIEVYTDYDSTFPTKKFTEPVSRSGGAGYWDDMVWNVDSWGGQSRLHVVQRGSPLGKARAVQMKVTGPESNANWGMDAVSLVYTPRKVR